MKRRFRVLCHWIDSKDESFLDCDEIQVSAENAGEAIREARRQWRLQVGAIYPSLRLEKVLILTPAQRLEVA